MAVRELVGDRVLDQLLAQSKDEAGQLRLTGEGSMLGELVRAVLERALEAELTAHLGYEPHAPAGHNSGNSRNRRISAMAIFLARSSLLGGNAT
jgi:transposase-like protein